MCNFNGWTDDDRKLWHSDVHKQFRKRDPFTCIHASIDTLDLLGAVMQFKPTCCENASANLRSIEASNQDYIHNGVNYTYSDGGQVIAPNYDGVTYSVFGRPHSCLCDRE